MSNKKLNTIKNITINKELKKYDSLTFLDIRKQHLELKDFQGNLVLLNFWATWCAPCKEEMPSLDLLQANKNLNNLKIIPINIGQEDTKKTNETNVANAWSSFQSSKSVLDSIKSHYKKLGNALIIKVDKLKSHTFEKLAKDIRRDLYKL